MTFDDLRPRLYAAAERVEARMIARYRAEHGLRPDDPNPPMLGKGPKTPIKFIVNRAQHIEFLADFLPLFADAGRSYEIGVGVGYFLRSAIDVCGLDITGCDINVDTVAVYKAMRAELDVADRVEEQGIYSGTAFRLPEGVRSVVTFLSMFDKDWEIADYRWFLEECRSQGARRIFWFGNANTMRPDIWSYLAGLGERPLPRYDDRFVIVDLARLH